MMNPNVAADPAVFRHDALMIIVNRSAAVASSLYEATRFAWRIDPIKAANMDVVLAVVQGVIRGAFVADRWLAATPANFPGWPDRPGRHGFVGREAGEAIARLYVGKRVPDAYRKPGAANPIKYATKAT